MKKLAAPSLLAAIVVTQTGCPVCEYPLGPEPHPNNHQARRIAEGPWMLELGQIERDGRCGAIDRDELRRLHAFVEHRGDRGLFIEIEGLVTRGEQYGPEVNTYGSIEEEVSVTEEPHYGEDEADTEGDEDGEATCGSQGGDVAEPPCEEEDEGREPAGDHPHEEPLYYGVAVSLSGLADGPRWMDGDLFIDLYEEGDVTCTISAHFSGYASDDEPGYAVDYADTDDEG